MNQDKCGLVGKLVSVTNNYRTRIHILPLEPTDFHIQLLNLLPRQPRAEKHLHLCVLNRFVIQDVFGCALLHTHFNKLTRQ